MLKPPRKEKLASALESKLCCVCQDSEREILLLPCNIFARAARVHRMIGWSRVPYVEEALRSKSKCTSRGNLHEIENFLFFFLFFFSCKWFRVLLLLLLFTYVVGMYDVGDITCRHA